jgi:methionyl-tRNA formyltransferase
LRLRDFAVKLCLKDDWRKMRIVFMGTPEFAVPSLKAVANSGNEVVAVVTNLDEPQGRGLKVFPPAVKTAALELGLRTIQVSSLKDTEFIGALEALSPDVMVVVAFRILPHEVYSIPKLGTFNLHASLLPKYRGAAPINWAIINGENETGVTTFFLDDKVDTGKVILQKKIPIGENETAGHLSRRLSSLGAEAVIETLKKIQNGNVGLIEQDNSQTTKAPKITKEDCLIDWSKPAPSVHNFIRGFSPEPGAFTFLGSKMMKIFKSGLVSYELSVISGQQSKEPGSIIIDSGRLFVSCAENVIEVLELQLEGKKKLSSADFLRGARIESGAQFKEKRD